MCRDTGPVTSSMSAWRGLATTDARAFDVVIGVVQRVYLQLAAVARARIDVADGQRAAVAQDFLLQLAHRRAAHDPVREWLRS